MVNLFNAKRWMFKYDELPSVSECYNAFPDRDRKNDSLNAYSLTIRWGAGERKIGIGCPVAFS